MAGENNTFLTPDIIANEALYQIENALVLGAKVHTDYSSEFATVGETISIERPVQFKGQEDNLDVTNYEEDILAGKIPVSMDKTHTVSFATTAKQRTFEISELAEKVIKPAITPLRDRVERALAGLYTDLSVFQGTPGTVPSTFKELAKVGANLTDLGVPLDMRFGMHPTDTGVELADGLKDVYVQDKAKKALEMVKLGRYANADHYESVHAPRHTVGAYSGTPLVAGASQVTTYRLAKDTYSSTLSTDGWDAGAILNKGDVITIAGVYEVNPITLETTGRLRTFTVAAQATADGGGAMDLSLTPALIPATATIEDGAAYATITEAPADNAVITVKSGTAGVSYPQSMLLHPNAFALVTRPLDIPGGAGLKTSTKTGKFVTVSCTESTDFNTLAHKFRFDILFGVKCIDPRLGARLTS